jgi:hypothetical protein
MKRILTGAAVLGMMAVPAMAGSVIVTPMQGTLGSPFNNGQLSGYGWNGVQGGGAGGLVGNLYDNILTMNGGAATAGFFGPFGDIPGGQAYVDWAGDESVAQWGDDLHGLAGPDLGGPTAVITQIRYGYNNLVASATHTISIYEMVPPSVTHGAGQTVVTDQWGAQLFSVVLPAMPLTEGAMVTVTGLSIHVGSAAWIKFAESGQVPIGDPPSTDDTRWLSGGIANGNGTSHDGVIYSNKTYYVDPPYPFHLFVNTPYFDFGGGLIVGPNIQVALSGFVIPAPAAMSLLGLGGLMALRRRRR